MEPTPLRLGPEQDETAEGQDVWGEVQHAALVWESLRAQGRELHFEPNPGTGRVVIQVRDLNGQVLRTLTPSEALSIASGTAL